jgi:Flp pilus assembly protein TadD
MAKPMLVTLPFVLLLLDWWPGRDGRYGRYDRFLFLVREKLPLFVLSAASSVVTFLVQRGGGAVTGLDALPLGLRLENAVMSYAGYLGKMVWPDDLAIVYSRPEHLSPLVVTGTALGLLAMSVVAFRLRRTRPYLFTGWFWYLGTLVPVIGIVQVGVQAMADRYTYIPLIGVCIAGAWAARDATLRWPRLARPATVGAVAIVLVCAWLARDQVGVWRNNATLFAHATQLATGGDAARAHLSVGATLLQQGRAEEALASFLEARRQAPDDPETHYHAGLGYAARQRYAEAATAFAEAIRLRPDFARAYAALGLASAQLGRTHEAIAHYRQAIRLAPDAETHNNLGSALANERRLDEALASFREAVRLKPEFHDARINLAVALGTLGRRPEAIAELQEVLRRDPSQARARAMLASIGGA